MEMNAWVNDVLRVNRDEYPDDDDYSETVEVVIADLKAMAREHYGDEDEALRMAVFMLVSSQNTYEFFDDDGESKTHIMFNTW